jgi:ABC-type molybdate transport system permease subunit
MTKNTPTAWTSFSLDPDPEPRCLNVPHPPSLEGLAEVLFMGAFGFISLMFGALALDFRDQHVSWVWPAVVCAVFALPVVLDVAARVFETVRYARYARSATYSRRWHSRHDCPENLGNDQASR